MTIAEKAFLEMELLTEEQQASVLDFIQHLITEQAPHLSELEREHVAEAIRRDREMELGLVETFDHKEFKNWLHNVC